MAIVSCSSVRDLKSPIVNLKSVSVQDPSLKDAQFVFHFSVQNPNEKDFEIDQIKYDLELNGKPFTQGIYSEKVKLASQSTVVVPLPVRIQYKDLMLSLTDYLQKKSIPYKLKGVVKVGLISVPFDDSGVVELKK